MKLLHISPHADKLPESSLTKTLKQRVARYAEVNTAHPTLNRRILQLTQKLQPDYVWMQIQTPGLIENETLQALRKSNAFIINWCADVRSPLPQWFAELGKQIELTLFTNLDDVRIAQSKGVRAAYCAPGYDPEIYFPDYNVHRDIDIAFFANNYRTLLPVSDYRMQAVKHLKTVYPQQFKLYGNGWGKADGNFNSSPLEEARTLRRCKIVLNISHHARERFTSDRLLKALGSGALCLIHRFPGMDDIGLIDGKTCAVSNDLTELQQKIDYYLTNEAQCKQIAAAGYKLAVENFTLHTMIENSLNFYYDNFSAAPLSRTCEKIA